MVAGGADAVDEHYPGSDDAMAGLELDVF